MLPCRRRFRKVAGTGALRRVMIPHSYTGLRCAEYGDGNAVEGVDLKSPKAHLRFKCTSVRDVAVCLYLFMQTPASCTSSSRTMIVRH